VKNSTKASENRFQKEINLCVTNLKW